MIPFLTRIDNEMAQTQDPSKRAELLAERASYLVRTGEFDEADRILAFLRENFGDGRNVRVSVWMMFVEGLKLYFERLSSAARDRIYRAHVICRAAQIADLSALVGAWLAHMEFERSAYVEMGSILRWILTEIRPHDYLAQCRVGMVLGDAFTYVGERKLARAWYAQSHAAAVRLGDRAAIGALMYNQAAFGLARLRVDHFGLGIPIDADALDFVHSGIDSSRRYQEGTQVTALTHLSALCEGRIAMLRGSFGGARDLLAPLLPVLQGADRLTDRLTVMADLVVCCFVVRRFDEAKQLIGCFNRLELGSMDTDDRFVASSMLLQVPLGADLGLSAMPIEREDVELARHDYSEEVASLQAILSSVQCGLSNEVGTPRSTIDAGSQGLE